MPRKPRQLIEQGIYHLYNRGNNRSNLFQSSEDFKVFLSLISAGKDRYSIQIFHYCLMHNHYHILLRISTQNSLSKFMHWVQLGYARYFKERYGSVGHVFQERFRSPLIAEESYYLQCGRYIERNPVKAGIVSKPWDYPYSSARYYCFGENNFLITENIYYKGLGLDIFERQSTYKQFITFDDPYSELIEQTLSKV